MENATKALMIAGSVLIALMILGALLLMFNNLTAYQNAENQNEKEAKVIEFNNQFETYLRNNVRGSEMISLMNRIIDYNTRKGDASEEKWQEMKIEINGISIDNFKYSAADTSILKTKYNQTDINNSDLIKKSTALEGKYGVDSITNLSSNISNIMDSEAKTKDLLTGRDLSIYGGYDQIKKDVATYFQYTQFKRVYFDYVPDKTKYNEQTGRIVSMEFKCKNKFQ